MSVVATMDEKIYYKHFTNDPVSTLSAVAYDRCSMVNSFVFTIG